MTGFSGQYPSFIEISQTIRIESSNKIFFYKMTQLTERRKLN